MSRKDRRNKSGDRSRPGRDFREIPGAGGGDRVVADPDGGRSARRKHAREHEVRPRQEGKTEALRGMADPDRDAIGVPREELDCARILGAKFDGVHDDSGALNLLREMRFDVFTEGRTVTCTITHLPSTFTATATGEGEVRMRAAAMRQMRDKLLAHFGLRLPFAPGNYGAAGDGVADDTDAVQRAIDDSIRWQGGAA